MRETYLASQRRTCTTADFVTTPLAIRVWSLRRWSSLLRQPKNEHRNAICSMSTRIFLRRSTTPRFHLQGRIFSRSMKPILWIRDPERNEIRLVHCGEVLRGALTSIKDNPMGQWLRNRRERFLDELLRLEGRGDHRWQTKCSTCPEVVGMVYRCRDCFTDALFCQPCVVTAHKDNPLHRVEVCLHCYAIETFN